MLCRASDMHSSLLADLENCRHAVKSGAHWLCFVVTVWHGLQTWDSCSTATEGMTFVGLKKGGGTTQRYVLSRRHPSCKQTANMHTAPIPRFCTLIDVVLIIYECVYLWMHWSQTQRGRKTDLGLGHYSHDSHDSIWFLSSNDVELGKTRDLHLPLDEEWARLDEGHPTFGVAE